MPSRPQPAVTRWMEIQERQRKISLHVHGQQSPDNTSLFHSTGQRAHAGRCCSSQHLTDASRQCIERWKLSVRKSRCALVIQVDCCAYGSWGQIKAEAYLGHGQLSIFTNFVIHHYFFPGNFTAESAWSLNDRIMQHPDLEGTHMDHQIQQNCTEHPKNLTMWLGKMSVCWAGSQTPT